MRSFLPHIHPYLFFSSLYGHSLLLTIVVLVTVNYNDCLLLLHNPAPTRPILISTPSQADFIPQLWAVCSGTTTYCYHFKPTRFTSFTDIYCDANRYFSLSTCTYIMLWLAIGRVWWHLLHGGIGSYPFLSSFQGHFFSFVLVIVAVMSKELHSSEYFFQIDPFYLYLAISITAPVSAIYLLCYTLFHSLRPWNITLLIL